MDVGKLCTCPLCRGLFWLLRQDTVDRWLLLSPPICLTFHSERWLFRCTWAQREAPVILSSVLIMNTAAHYPQDWPDCHVSWGLGLKAKSWWAVVFLTCWIQKRVHSWLKHRPVGIEQCLFSISPWLVLRDLNKFHILNVGIHIIPHCLYSTDINDGSNCTASCTKQVKGNQYLRTRTSYRTGPVEYIRFSSCIYSSNVLHIVFYWSFYLTSVFPQVDLASQLRLIMLWGFHIIEQRQH